ncbi:MAG: ATP-dependent helicase [Eubacterium sp.]|nr:ATP-dependent helicase [Eubacterium sp.]
MGFTEEQIKAIEWYEGPLMVIGTPGSGKTTVIVNRVNNLIYEYDVRPENILVITFTKAAAVSMKERFLELSGLTSTNVRFGTFHSFFYWIIRTAYGDKLNLGVLDEQKKREVLRTILRKLGPETYDNEETLVSVMNQLGIISCNMIDIENYYSRDMSGNDFVTTYRLYKEYKERNGLIDFDDMVTECYKLLKDRLDILEKIRELYPFIMVDEYQDTNMIQYEILKMLAHPRDNIYVVGDDDQSIYGFRGARPDIMHKFTKEFRNASTLQLSNNFRCPKEIVEFSSSIIADNKKRYGKSLKSVVSSKGQVTIDDMRTQTDEYNLILSRLQKAFKKGVSPSNIAIIYRTNLGPRRLMYKLSSYNVPFNVRDAIPDITNHIYVRPILSYIRYAMGDHSRKVFLDIMNKPVRYISRDMLTSEVVELEDLLRAAKGKDYLRDNIKRMISEIRTISKLSPFAAVNYIRRAVDYDGYLKKLAEDRNIDYDEISDMLDEFQSMISDSDTFLQMFEMLETSRKPKEEKEEEVDGIQLMTLHSAKGLEFSEVHILDAVEGSIPHKKSKSPDEIEEERRLFYVGITRSSNNLYIYVPREIGDRQVSPSRFLGKKGDKNGTWRN